jgi:hypothetical protein
MSEQTNLDITQSYIDEAKITYKTNTKSSQMISIDKGNYKIL